MTWSESQVYFNSLLFVCVRSVFFCFVFVFWCWVNPGMSAQPLNVFYNCYLYQRQRKPLKVHHKLEKLTVHSCKLWVISNIAYNRPLKGFRHWVERTSGQMKCNSWFINFICWRNRMLCKCWKIWKLFVSTKEMRARERDSPSWFLSIMFTWARHKMMILNFFYGSIQLLLCPQKPVCNPYDCYFLCLFNKNCLLNLSIHQSRTLNRKCRKSKSLFWPAEVCLIDWIHRKAKCKAAC